LIALEENMYKSAEQIAFEVLQKIGGIWNPNAAPGAVAGTLNAFKPLKSTTNKTKTLGTTVTGNGVSGSGGGSGSSPTGGIK